MATSKAYFSRQNYRFLASDRTPSSYIADAAFELVESDLYNNYTGSNSPEFRRSMPGPLSKKSSTRLDFHAVARTSSSLPVNIPDWSKILKGDYRENRMRDSDDDDDEMDGCDGDGGVRIPPHEFLARSRIASFSVHEGIGRTLKGRDLSRVRDAVWEKIGFQD